MPRRFALLFPVCAVWAIPASAFAADEPAPPATSSTPEPVAAPPAPPPPPPAEEAEARKAIYLSGDLGATRVMLGAVMNDYGFDRTAANGVLYGLGAGLRFKNCRIGARWRVQDTTEVTLWTLAASIGYALPWRPISPILSLHLGYVFDQEVQAGVIRGSLPVGNVLPPNVDLRGAVLGLDLNASYWVSKALRVGAFVGVDAMYLHRSKTPPPQSLFGPVPELAGNPLYADSGDGIGVNVNLGLRGAFDIALE
jgi:hypothetical protein